MVGDGFHWFSGHDGGSLFSWCALFHAASGVLCQIVLMRLYGLGPWGAAAMGMLLHTVYEAKDAYFTYGVCKENKSLLRAAAAAVRRDRLRAASMHLVHTGL